MTERAISATRCWAGVSAGINSPLIQFPVRKFINPNGQVGGVVGGDDCAKRTGVGQTRVVNFTDQFTIDVQLEVVARSPDAEPVGLIRAGQQGVGGVGATFQAGILAAVPVPEIPVTGAGNLEPVPFDEIGAAQHQAVTVVTGTFSNLDFGFKVGIAQFGAARPPAAKAGGIPAGEDQC